MKNKDKILIVLVAIGATFLNTILSSFLYRTFYGSLGKTFSVLLTAFLSLAIISVGIYLIAYLLNRPSKLTGANGKPLTNSKTFWSAFLIFILTSLQEVIGLNDGASIIEIGDLINNMDFSNVLVSILSMIVIFIRYFDVQKLINSILPDKEIE